MTQAEQMSVWCLFIAGSCDAVKTAAGVTEGVISDTDIWKK